MNEMMDFPDTFDEFAKLYQIIDTEEIYSNGIEFIPVFRVKQWLEYLAKREMTDRQKEMFKKRAILEFLADNTDLTMKDIDSYSLIREIKGADSLPPLLLSHYALYIHLANNANILYIPKERFKVKEANHVDTDSE